MSKDDIIKSVDSVLEGPLRILNVEIWCCQGMLAYQLRYLDVFEIIDNGADWIADCYIPKKKSLSGLFWGSSYLVIVSPVN